MLLGAVEHGQHGDKARPLGAAQIELVVLVVEGPVLERFGAELLGHLVGIRFLSHPIQQFDLLLGMVWHFRRRGGGMQGRVQGGGGVTHGRRSPAAWSASRGRLASQLEVTEIVGVHFTVDLTDQVGTHFHFLRRYLHVVGGQPGVDPGNGVLLGTNEGGLQADRAHAQVGDVLHVLAEDVLVQADHGAILEQVLGPLLLLQGCFLEQLEAGLLALDGDLRHVGVVVAAAHQVQHVLGAGQVQRFVARNQLDDFGVAFHQLAFGKSKRAGKKRKFECKVHLSGHSHDHI